MARSRDPFFREDDLPDIGAVLAFRLPDGRFGACRVLGKLPVDKKRSSMNAWKGASVIVMLTRWIGPKVPSGAEPDLREMFRKTHHSWEGQPEIWNIPVPITKELFLVGHIDPTKEERARRTGSLGAFWGTIPWGEQLVKQWDWDHNRAELLAAEARSDDKESAAAEQRAAARIAELRTMSLADFRASRFLSAWSSRSFPKSGVAAARKVFRDAVDQLIALGAKVTRKQRLAMLESLVKALNVVQKTHGGFMETMERDDITEHLGELLVVLRMKDDPAVLFETWEDL